MKHMDFALKYRNPNTTNNILSGIKRNAKHNGSSRMNDQVFNEKESATR
jgi:hypothetical protein